jgi:hypothetical protein
MKKDNTIDEGRTFIKLFHSHFKDVDALDDDIRLRIYDAYFRYAFNGEEPDFSDNAILHAYWNMLKRYLIASETNYKNAVSGNRKRKARATLAPNECQTSADASPTININIQDKDKDKDKDLSVLTHTDLVQECANADEQESLDDEKNEIEATKKYFTRFYSQTNRESMIRMCHNSNVDENSFFAACDQLRQLWEEVPPEHHSTYSEFKKHLVNAARLKLEKEKGGGVPIQTRAQQQRTHAQNLVDWAARQAAAALNNTQ